MKKVLVIIAAALLCVNLQTWADGTEVNYIKSGEKVYFGKSIHIGLFNTRMELEDGSSILLPNKKVDAYSKGQRVFERLPILNESNQVQGFKMMELIKTRAGLNLYRSKISSSDGVCYDWYVFKGGKLYLNLTEKNQSNVLPFFGLTLCEN